MSGDRIENTAAVISYVEANLDEKLDLNTVADAVCYSKYHLHRMFADTVGITLHDYIRRRRLTEAARLLVFSERPLMEIALTAGFESQQAFTSIFKSMYKRTPLAYRRNGVFYPLQLEYRLNRDPSASGALPHTISYAGPEDLSDWMRFVSLVVDGFPCLNETAHMEQVRRHMGQRQALVMRDGPLIVGAAVFSRRTGHIGFLAAHPQYWRYGMEEALLDFITRRLAAGRELSITTFREGDRADTGQRKEYKRLGFVEAELLTEFGYPAQRLILPPGQEAGGHG